MMKNNSKLQILGIHFPTRTNHDCRSAKGLHSVQARLQLSARAAPGAGGPVDARSLGARSLGAGGVQGLPLEHRRGGKGGRQPLRGRPRRDAAGALCALFRAAAAAPAAVPPQRPPLPRPAAGRAGRRPARGREWLQGALGVGPAGRDGGVAQAGRCRRRRLRGRRGRQRDNLRRQATYDNPLQLQPAGASAHSCAAARAAGERAGHGW